VKVLQLPFLINLVEKMLAAKKELSAIKTDDTIFIHVNAPPSKAKLIRFPLPEFSFIHPRCAYFVWLNCSLNR
jgi:hypothetical protein